MTLRQLFNQYKKKYNLKTKLKFDYSHDFNGLYNHICNIITINSSEITLLDETPIKWVLLHEIRHAIDFTYYTSRSLKEIRKINRHIYSWNVDYHNNLTQEKRAINFIPNKEFKKIKGEKKYVYSNIRIYKT